jgi:hypothetical protein
VPPEGVQVCATSEEKAIPTLEGVGRILSRNRSSFYREPAITALSSESTHKRTLYAAH